ncbi:MAG: hypothetical protein HN820_07590, partial [Candidatus Marinimicrobia bacterium]|nr:hypothetical protein [Candidatus Neomarinimicrobiota bacterium]
MIKQKNIFLFFTIVFILLNIASGKSHFKKKFEIQSRLKIQDEILKREITSQGNQTVSTRTQTTYFLDTFDSNLDGWTIDDGWIKTDNDFYSPDYSMNSYDNNQSLPQLWQLTSPTYPLPEQPLNET